MLKKIKQLKIFSDGSSHVVFDVKFKNNKLVNDCDFKNSKNLIILKNDNKIKIFNYRDKFL